MLAIHPRIGHPRIGHPTTYPTLDIHNAGQIGYPLMRQGAPGMALAEKDGRRRLEIRSKEDFSGRDLKQRDRGYS
jgi:hypothetical protein